MAGEKHLLLTAQGDYVDGSLAPETWMVTLRLILNGGDPDQVGTLPTNWDVSAQTINRTETDWTITSNWRATELLPPFTFQPDDYLNDQAAPAFAGWMGGFPGISSQARLRRLRLYPIGTNGKAIPAPPYATGSPCELVWTSSDPVGGSSAQQLPLQIAGVVSHRTPQVGRSGRGRMFVPALTTTAVDHDSLFSASWCSTAANAQKNLLEGLAFTEIGRAHV